VLIISFERCGIEEVMNVINWNVWPKIGVSEIRVLLAAIILKKLGEKITSENISKITEMNIQHVRNTLRILEVKGLLKTISSPGVQSLIASTSGRVKVYDLAMSIEEILNKFPEVLDFVRGIREEDLRASTTEEFLRKIENLPHNSLGAEIRRKLQERS
jgi:predicted transcriptional regulator